MRRWTENYKLAKEVSRRGLLDGHGRLESPPPVYAAPGYPSMPPLDTPVYPTLRAPPVAQHKPVTWTSSQSVKLQLRECWGAGYMCCQPTHTGCHMQSPLTPNTGMQLDHLLCANLSLAQVPVLATVCGCHLWLFLCKPCTLARGSLSPSYIFSSPTA